jgi:hypothetical protein
MNKITFGHASFVDESLLPHMLAGVFINRRIEVTGTGELLS